MGELVLDGFPRVDRDLVAAVFATELTRLFTERREPYPAGVPLATTTDRDVDLLAGLPPLPPTTSSRRLGRALARSVHTGLTATEVGR
ncbi:hypothetical protein HKK72_36565 [Actinomadura sp. HBU206391]|nr:hypothetical protein [Actinomadura sp. HBU206391]